MTRFEQDLTDLIRQAQQEQHKFHEEFNKNIEEWFCARNELLVQFKVTARVLSEAGFESSCLLYNGGLILRANRNGTICGNIIVTPDFSGGWALWEESECSDDEHMSLPLNLSWWEFRLVQFAKKVVTKK